MPEAEYAWLPRSEILDFEEILVVVDAFLLLGLESVRLTGGEPLLRRGIHELIAELAARPKLSEVALTTNGVLLASHAEMLRRAGLDRVTVSLDTLSPTRFQAISRRASHSDVISGLLSLGPAGFNDVKIDTVVVRGINDDELVALLEFARSVSAEIRFIEYMDVGGATNWDRSLVASKNDILRLLSDVYGPIAQMERTAAPATRFRLPDGTTFGIVASVTEPFCATCDRSRLTADGIWYRCLYAACGTDLRSMVRSGMRSEELAGEIGELWSARQDQGAVDRHGRQRRLLPLRVLREDPHLEMHTRGG
jgi:cyclic pyranopterin phosphate synthase